MRISAIFLALLLACHCATAQEGRGNSSSHSRTDVRLDENAPELNSQEEVEDWVKTDLKKELGLGEDHDLEVGKKSTGLGSGSTYEVKQTLNGIPVVSLETRVILGPDKKPLYVLGKSNGEIKSEVTKATITIEQALEAASHIPETDFEYRLVYWLDAEPKPYLAYEIKGSFAVENMPSEQRVYVDATDAKILERLSLQHSAMQRGVAHFAQSCRDLNVNSALSAQESLMVTVHAAEHNSREEGQGPSGVAAIDRPFDLLGELYQFVLNTYQRDSLDNQGMPLILISDVRYIPGVPWGQCRGNGFNASWNDGVGAMFIPMSAMEVVEVVGHEFAHGLISSGSNLVYRGESGALNESISDALGVTFRAWYEVTGKRPTNNSMPDYVWQLRAPNRILRDMKLPKRAEPHAPDHFDDFVYLPHDEHNDWGGVHVNSSIMNVGFYLLSEGGQHPRLGSGSRVEGIGIFKASQIYVGAAAAVLTSHSDFADARVGFAHAAELLFGRGSREWQSVHESMDAIGIPGQWSMPKPQPKPTPNNVPSPVPTPDAIQTPASAPNSPVPSPTVPDTATDHTRTILLSVLAATALGVVVLLAFKLRPNHAEAAINHRSTHSSSPSGKTQTQPDKGGDSIRVAVLTPLDGSAEIRLTKAFLDGLEGMIVGRAGELVHVQIDNSAVSRRHLRFKLEGMQLTLEDLNSSQGTMVNGKTLEPFKPMNLVGNELIRIAGFSYQLAISA